MSIEAMKQALEALEESVFPRQSVEHYKKYDEAVNALSQAIEQAEKQEPVAWVYLENWGSGKFWPDDCFREDYASPEMTPLYTAPHKREWVGLTDEDIDILQLGLMREYRHGTVSLARAVEKLLKEKNT